MLTEHFHDIRITGEVSNLRAYPSGHLYFALKDEESQIDAVCFRTSAARLKFKLEDGLQVVGHGRLDLYTPRGKYQVVLDSIEPAGLGALQKAFEQLKRKLEKEGLFDEKRKQPVPTLPRTVGIVTSPAGAAIHDMLRTLRLNRAGVKVLLYPAQVQGAGAAEQVAEGVRVLNEVEGMDVIIVGRGGGSIEDLWCFNEENVARAIAGSGAPVVSGIGHETDFTIADFVADLRAATPTAAAQAVAQGWAVLSDRLNDAAGRLVERMEQDMLAREQRLEESARHRAFQVVHTRLADARHEVARLWSLTEIRVVRMMRKHGVVLAKLEERLARQHPATALARARSRLARLLDRAGGRASVAMERAGSKLGSATAKLGALSPLASLARGYSICRKPDGSVVSRRAQVAAGDAVGVRVSDGTIACEVKSVAAADGGTEDSDK